MKNRHLDFLNHIKSFIPSQRIYTDYLRRLAWGTDAGFYRLTPQIVVRSDGEQEVTKIIRAAAQFDVPLTFRAAGTSLSGQSVSDSVLVVAGKNWEDYEVLERYALALFERGSQMAAERGLILVDTKYEFGKRDGEITLIDEIHTPDSSRYFYAAGYEERFARGEQQRQLSKEFVREWLMANGFQGQEGAEVPEMTPEIGGSISDRYIELYENITGEKFDKGEADGDRMERMQANIANMIARLR